MTATAAEPGKGPATTQITMFAVDGLPLIRVGDSLATEILSGMSKGGEEFFDGDIVVIAQKIVSKSEGRQVNLADVKPSKAALDLYELTRKDPRLIELILRESTSVLRTRPDLIIVVHRLGHVVANAGIDQSNVEHLDGEESVLLLPEDPQRSCEVLRQEFRHAAGVDVGVIINDSFGRAWRNGTTGTAIGVSGIEALRDLRGQPDLYGRLMQTSAVAVADQISAMASLLQGEGDEGRPVVICRGLGGFLGRGDVNVLLRPAAEDLFR